MFGEAADTAAVARYATAARAVLWLARAMKNVTFYGPAHPLVATALQEFLSEIQDQLEERRELVLKFVNSYVVVDDRPVLGNKVGLAGLVGACHRRKVEAVVFHRGVRADEIEKFVGLLATDCGEVERSGGIHELMVREGIQHIALERLTSTKKDDWHWVHACTLDVLRGAATGIRTGRPMDIAGVQMRVREIVDDVLGDSSLLHNIHAMKDIDEYTFVHALNICILATELGQRLGCETSNLEELAVATLLHDIGKIFVPLQVLRKPTRLDDEEFAVISRHPVDGALALAGEPQLPDVAALVAFEHHIHLDGSGYPQVRRPRDLNLYSLITSVCDIYDALTTARPYRPPLPPVRAVEVLRQEFGGRLEPTLLKQFLAMLGPYPVSTLLGFPDGRLAVITRPNPAAPENPFARAMEERSGTPQLVSSEAPVRELAGSPGGLEVVDPVSLGLDLIELLYESATRATLDAERSVGLM